MLVYIYAADIYCQQCGEAIRERITREGFAPAEPDDEWSYDSDEFPKGPYPDGGGEADCPQHCGAGPECHNAIEFPPRLQGWRVAGKRTDHRWRRVCPRSDSRGWGSGRNVGRLLPRL